MKNLKKKYTNSLNTLGIGLFFLGTNNLASSTVVTVGYCSMVVLGLSLMFSHFALTLIDGWKLGGIRNAVSSILVTYLLDIGVALLGVYQSFSPMVSAIMVVLAGNLIVLHFGLIWLLNKYNGGSP
ncbi:MULTISPECIES: hypothetical protein [Shewanella]|nr:hypothetical protein [Shewanella xiamenensis]MCT8869272.1 hypothetical protein [Shewanella xiamenensis]MCT8873885.1 hypothetical protein [Shewanella xiamenensis]MCT8877551.1 hypothetical protein [Shewanella xiamenensis]UWH39985.1 hypothetical protein KXJ80_00340 [Shewanella xiamenensis]BDQ68439.1 hypothetical protein NUITMVS2_42520 [Shewanella xiamenensis]